MSKLKLEEVNTLSLLEAAKALILEPANWTVGTPARDKDNNDCPVDSEAACQFCTYGALRKVDPRVLYVRAAGDPRHEATELVRQSAKELGYSTIAHLNDNAGHPVVMQMFDKAIAAAKKGVPGYFSPANLDKLLKDGKC